MNKIKLSFFGIIFAWICAAFFVFSPANASTISYAVLGEEFVAEIEKYARGSEISWVLTKDGEILETQKKKKFSYVFDESGEYITRVIVTKKDNTQVYTTMKIIVGNSLPNFAPLEANFSSVPAEKDGVISLSGTKETVLFSFDLSTGPIANYEFDANIFADTNGDGIIDNDIDNKNDPSYVAGSVFSYTYENDGIPARARLRILDSENNVQERFVNILFSDDTEMKESLEKKSLKAVMKTLPHSEGGGDIIATDDMKNIMVVSKYSEGKITQYHIDSDLSTDSDADGKADNDIDNKNHPSFLSGEMFPIPLASGRENQDIKLTVVDDSGKKSALQKKIVFISPAVENESTPLEPSLFASRTKVFSGETISFRLFNIPENATTLWDFESDGTFEVPAGKLETVYYEFAEEGDHSLTVHVKQEGEDDILLKQEVFVLGNKSGSVLTDPPKAFFSVDVDGNLVSFSSSESHADPRLSNQDISYSWDFGDGYKTQGPNPSHVYKELGEYQVVLRVEDSLERATELSVPVNIEALTNSFDQGQHGGSVDGSTPDPTPENQNPEVTPSVPVEGGGTDPVDPSSSATGNNEQENNTSSSEAIKEQVKGVTSAVPNLPWWLLLLLFLLLVPFLIIIKKKIDEPEKDISEIFQGVISKKKEIPIIPEEVGIVEEKQSEEVQENSVEDSDTADEEASHPDWMRDYDAEMEESKIEDASNETNSSSDFIVQESPEEGTTMLLDENTSENEPNPFLSEPEPNSQETQEDSPTPSWLSGADSILDEPLPDDDKETKKEEETSSFLVTPEEESSPVAVEESTNDVFLSEPAPEENTSSANETPSEISESAESPFSVDHPEWLKDITVEEEKELEENSENFAENLQNDEVFVEEGKTEEIDPVVSENEEKNEENVSENLTPSWLSEDPVENSEKNSSENENFEEKLPAEEELSENEVLQAENDENSEKNSEKIDDIQQEEDKIFGNDAKIPKSAQSSGNNIPDWLKKDED